MNSTKNNSLKKNQAKIAVNQTTESTMSNQSSDSVSPNENQASSSRQQPIPPPSHPRQYRAIGLIRARYRQSSEQMTQGTLITTDGAEIEAVLLGRIISLIKNHLDLEKEHLWVVYPRTKMNDDRLHVQIVGVWEPETLSQNTDAEEIHSEEAEHGYFSIRGEVIFYSVEEKNVIVKIKQFPRKTGDKPKFFKLKLQGLPSDKPLKRFWDLKVRLAGEDLIIESGTDLGFAQKRKPKFKPDKKKIQLKSPRTSIASKPNPTKRPIVTKKPKSEG
ncbi:hypothetical protein NIES4102_17570 [Chondrocystis sp. NIES-4102]|nr:hypothetical protein NIES4102_17570 [Chondrocystis sp. NIES-4102]